MPQFIVVYAYYKDRQTEVIHFANENSLRKRLTHEVIHSQDEEECYYLDEPNNNVKFVEDPSILDTPQLIKNAVHWGRLSVDFGQVWGIVHVTAIADDGKVTLYGPTVYKR